jgi:serine/threonine protein kinase
MAERKLWERLPARGMPITLSRLIATCASPRQGYDWLHLLFDRPCVGDFSSVVDSLFGEDEMGAVADNGMAVKEDAARFYIGCAVITLQYLHKHKILCRALAPELLMLGSGEVHDGYLMLIDFRTSTKLAKGGRTFTMAGAPEYMAPEQVKGQGHGLAVDYWWVLPVIACSLKVLAP